jgi:MFS transporter, DHA1 family, tetracycline resistance protein
MIRDISKLTLFGLFMTIFVDAIGVALVYPILTPLFVNNNTLLFSPSVSIEIRNLIYGLVLALYPLMMFLFSPFLGALSDKYGRRPVLLFCLAGNLFGLVMMGIGVSFSNIAIILLARIITGMTAANMPIAQAAIIDISSEQTKAKNLSLITAANSIGFVIGPMLAGILSQPIFGRMSTTAPFYIAALLPFATLFLLLFYFKEASTPNKKLKIRFLSAFHSIYLGFKQLNTRMPLFIFASFLTGYYLFFSFLSMFALVKFEYNQLMESILLGYFCIVFGCSLLFFIPWFTKRYALPRCLLMSAVPQAFAVLALLAFPYIATLWAAATVMAIFVPCSYVALISILSNNTEKASQGKIMGVSMSVNSFAWGTTPLFVALLQNYSLMLPFVVSTSVLFFTLYLVIYYVREPRTSPVL